jgi:hypothetical protein
MVSGIEEFARSFSLLCDFLEAVTVTFGAFFALENKFRSIVLTPGFQEAAEDVCAVLTDLSYTIVLSIL